MMGSRDYQTWNRRVEPRGWRPERRVTGIQKRSVTGIQNGRLKASRTQGYTDERG